MPIADASSYHVLGAGHVYIQFYTGSAPSAVLGLGIATQGVRPRLEPIWEPAPNDATGGAPAEKSFDGVAGTIPYSLSIWNPTVLEKAKLWLPNQSQVPGVIPAGGIGSLLITGLNFFRVLIWRSKAAATGEQPFVNFPMCRLASIDEPTESRGARISMVWEVIDGISVCTGGGPVYDNDGDGWPGPICIG